MVNKPPAVGNGPATVLSYPLDQNLGEKRMILVNWNLENSLATPNASKKCVKNVLIKQAQVTAILVF